MTENATVRDIRAKHPYTVEEVKVGDLYVDPRVQRDALSTSKVNGFVKKFNADALGIITVSQRADRGYYIVDGQHRVETVRRVNDGGGTVTCHVYTGLTLEEEAALFLALNERTNVLPLDKHKVRVTEGDPQALRVEEAVHKYGWKISPVPNNGNVNAIQKLYALDTLSQKIEAEPDLISLVFLIITRAWGNDRHGAQSVIMEGLGRLLAEHGDRINIPTLIEKLKNYRGGPQALHAAAAAYANLTKGKVSMSVAHLVTEWYNKGKGERKSALPAWRKRT